MTFHLNQFYLTRSTWRNKTKQISIAGKCLESTETKKPNKNWLPKWCLPSQAGMNIWIWNMKCQVFLIAFLPIVGLSQYSRVPWKSTCLPRNEGPVKHFIIQCLEVEQQHVCHKCCMLQEILNADFSFIPWKAEVLWKREKLKQGLLFLFSQSSMLCPQYFLPCQNPFPILCNSRQHEISS